MSIDTSNTATHTFDMPQLLLEHHLKELRPPNMLREYDQIAYSGRSSSPTVQKIPTGEIIWRHGEL